MAAVEKLNFHLNPIISSVNRGIQGGLSGEIADRVETTPLLSGPLVATLRRYQTFGARYLIVQERTLLGDDMGLGKTVQVLAAMCHLHALGSRHFFVVAPNSVLINWQREIQKHTELRAIVVHGADRDSSILEWQALGGVAVTTYGTVSKIIDHIPAIDFFAVDEAHYAKNPEALRTKAITTLAMRSQYITLMTGTALENRLGELCSLVGLAQPDLGSKIEETLQTHEGFISPEIISAIIAPAYLRRTQSDVLTELPERVHVDEWIELTDIDRSAYRDSQGDLMSRRLAACVGNGSKTSAKYTRLSELIEEHTSAGRKVVVFSYFRQVITDVCALTGGSPSITGDTSSTERQRIIDQFSNDSSATVLVSQIDAGGIGINLQSAQVVILMEPQFKPSTEWQAIARVHRMGQSRTVLVHRLLARKTIDERLVQLIEEKTQTFMSYANDSEVRDASVMAIDTNNEDFEAELKRLLEENPDL
jgi:SNF2 family DNA or RNA helicase